MLLIVWTVGVFVIGIICGHWYRWLLYDATTKQMRRYYEWHELPDWVSNKDGGEAD